MATLTGFDPGPAGGWIKSVCHRVNILFTADHGRLLEAFLHVRMRPRHES